jgi:very-short-patch-repair endonuclease
MLRDRARQLRRDQTDVESKLWSRLRARQLSGAKFRRQYPIGAFIADFCCYERRLVIELDGGHHAELVDADQSRTDFFVSQGYRVLRFWNNEVIENIDGVLGQIAHTLTLSLSQRARVGKEQESYERRGERLDPPYPLTPYVPTERI